MNDEIALCHDCGEILVGGEDLFEFMWASEHKNYTIYGVKV